MTKELGIAPKWQAIDNLNSLFLGKEELHLWWLPLQLEEHQRNTAYSLLNKRQLNKYERRSNPELQHAYLASRYYLFTLLAAYQKCNPKDIKLRYSRLNKPYIDSHANTDSQDTLEFNFTDTNIDQKSYALYAFSWNRQVGIDIEALERSANFKQIAERRFTTQELDFATHASGEIDPQKCLSIWTRKEAYGKATGKGINFEMNKRNLVNGDSNKNPFYYNFNDGNSDWRLLQIQPTPNFIACVVHEGHQPLSIKTFTRP